MIRHHYDEIQYSTQNTGWESDKKKKTHENITDIMQQSECLVVNQIMV